jgi:hypothetical protein
MPQQPSPPRRHVGWFQCAVHAPPGGGGRHRGGGRSVVAAPPPHCSHVERGVVVCRSPAFVLSVIEEWKKRVCARCFAIGGARLSHRCTGCDQAYYCSAGCRSAHWVHGGSGTSPHARTCAALRCFSLAKKFSKSDVSMLRLMLEVIARPGAGPCLEEPAVPAAPELEPGPQLEPEPELEPELAVDASWTVSFDALESHEPRWDVVPWCLGLGRSPRSLGAACSPWFGGLPRPSHCF